MDFLSRSPFAVASVLWQPRADRWMFTVVCKATFVLGPGLCPLAPQQEPPHPADVYRGNDERYSLLCAGELVPFKRNPEVLLVGSAFAPHGAPVPSLRACLAVGGVQKSIEVMGDRFITPAGELTAPTPFTRMPLVWERAAGGPGTANPAGVRMGSAAVPDAWGRVAIPNLQPPGGTLLSRRDVLQSVGFAPIAPHWPSRAGRLRAVAQGWDFRRWNAQSLPAGFDAWFFNAAPDDQQLPELCGDEQIVLENLHPNFPRLQTRMQPVAPRAIVDWPEGRTEPVELHCDTLIIDTDRGTVALIWRGHVPLDHPQRAGLVIIAQGARRFDRPPATPAHQAAPATEHWSAQSAESTLDVGALVQRTGAKNPLPFVNAPASAAAAPYSPAPVAPLSSAAPVSFEEQAEQTLAPWFEAKNPLPFDVPALREPARDTGSRSVPQTDLLPPPMTAPAIAQAAAQVSVVDIPVSSPAPIFDSAAEADATEEEIVTRRGKDRSWLESADESASPVEVAPPPMLGPLAPVLAEGSWAEGRALEGGASIETTAAKPSADSALALENYPIERCAAIAASIDRRGAEKDEILKENELSAKAWTGIEQRWEKAIDEDIARGKTDLLQRFDAAYVAQLEKERGSIQVEEYARLGVAAERDTTEEVLAALSIPEEALMRVERVWLQNIISDKALGKRVRQAREKARADA